MTGKTYGEQVPGLVIDGKTITAGVGRAWSMSARSGQRRA
jgi:hypothetical protein